VKLALNTTAKILVADRVHHELNVLGRGVRIAVIDDGDIFGHQTSVIAHIKTIAPEVEIIELPFMRDDSEQSHLSSFIESIYRAIRERADILNISSGLNNNIVNHRGLEDTIKDVVENHRIIMAASVGNSGYFMPGHKQVSISYPAVDPHVIAVGGVYYDIDTHKIQASNIALSGQQQHNDRKCPDVCGLCGMLPYGKYIMAPTRAGSLVDYICSTQLHDGTAPDDGIIGCTLTSDSVAMVSGVIALMLEYDKENRKNPELVRQRLEASCVDVVEGFSGSGHHAHEGRDLATGAGLVHAYDAVMFGELREGGETN